MREELSRSWWGYSAAPGVLIVTNGGTRSTSRPKERVARVLDARASMENSKAHHDVSWRSRNLRESDLGLDVVPGPYPSYRGSLLRCPSSLLYIHLLPSALIGTLATFLSLCPCVAPRSSYPVGRSIFHAEPLGVNPRPQHAAVQTSGIPVQTQSEQLTRENSESCCAIASVGPQRRAHSPS
jgi:hypothetical protein